MHVHIGIDYFSVVFAGIRRAGKNWGARVRIHQTNSSLERQTDSSDEHDLFVGFHCKQHQNGTRRYCVECRQRDSARAVHFFDRLQRGRQQVGRPLFGRHASHEHRIATCFRARKLKIRHGHPVYVLLRPKTLLGKS